jgi:hypothetical protein
MLEYDQIRLADMFFVYRSGSKGFHFLHDYYQKTFISLRTGTALKSSKESFSKDEIIITLAKLTPSPFNPAIHI